MWLRGVAFGQAIDLESFYLVESECVFRFNSNDLEGRCGVPGRREALRALQEGTHLGGGA